MAGGVAGGLPDSRTGSGGVKGTSVVLTRPARMKADVHTAINKRNAKTTKIHGKREMKRDRDFMARSNHGAGDFAALGLGPRKRVVLRSFAPPGSARTSKAISVGP